MWQILEEPSFLGRATMIEQDKAVLDRSNTVVNAVQKQKSTAGLVDNTSLDERELLLCMFGEVGIVVVTVLLCPGWG